VQVQLGQQQYYNVRIVCISQHKHAHTQGGILVPERMTAINTDDVPNIFRPCKARTFCLTLNKLRQATQDAMPMIILTLALAHSHPWDRIA
jgi:hypothetical protein